MSNEISEILHGDNNGNEKKDAIAVPTTPKKRTPSKRASFIERAQKESEELIKNMGLDLDIGGGRKTRSSTRGTPTLHTVESSPPPSKKSKGDVTSTPRRGRPKKADHLEEASESKKQLNENTIKDKLENAKPTEEDITETPYIEEVEKKTDESVIVDNKVESNNDISKNKMDTEQIEDKIATKDNLSECVNDTNLSKKTIVTDDKIVINDDISEDIAVGNSDKLVIVEDKLDLTDDKSENIVDTTNEEVAEVNNVIQSENISSTKEKSKPICENPVQICENEQTKQSPIVDPIEVDDSVDSKPNADSDKSKNLFVYEIHNSDSSDSSIEIISCGFEKNNDQAVNEGNVTDTEQSNLIINLPNSEPATTTLSKETEIEENETISAINDNLANDICETKTSSPPSATLSETVSTP